MSLTIEFPISLLEFPPLSSRRSAVQFPRLSLGSDTLVQFPLFNFKLSFLSSVPAVELPWCVVHIPLFSSLDSFSSIQFTTLGSVPSVELSSLG